MRLVSLNIRYGTADDGPFSWVHRREALLSFLRDIDADVLCLQEVLDFQLDEIGAALTGYGVVGVGRNDGERAGEFAPIFYRNLDLLGSGTLWLSETPGVAGSMGWGARHPRICTWTRFKEFTIGNLHLDHESEEARVKGVGVVTRLCNADIVCGDFNATPSEACIAAMLSTGYCDLGPADGTYNGFDPTPVNPPKIDYVFARPPVSGVTKVVQKPLVSDHWAVVAEIDLA